MIDVLLIEEGRILSTDRCAACRYWYSATVIFAVVLIFQVKVCLELFCLFVYGSNNIGAGETIVFMTGKGSMFKLPHGGAIWTHRDLVEKWGYAIQGMLGSSKNEACMVKASDTCATEAVFLHPGLNWNLVQRRRRKNMFKLPHTTLWLILSPWIQVQAYKIRRRYLYSGSTFCNHIYAVYVPALFKCKVMPLKRYMYALLILKADERFNFLIDSVFRFLSPSLANCFRGSLEVPLQFPKI